MSELPLCDNYADILTGPAALLDVRAPVEFAKGAFPNTCNIPLLDDKARHLVGIEYKKAGQQAAIDLGGRLLPDSVRESLTNRWLGFTSQHPEGYLYCFRGGLRSRIVQQWLHDAGRSYPIVKGGYKALRRYSIDALAQQCEELPLCLLGGRTGTGKTRLLNTIPRSIDLEGLARHRGSSFGRMVVDQPSNIDFENAIAIEMLKHARQGKSAVFLEDEARMIGSACIPLPLRERMQTAPVVILETSLSRRVQIAIEDYVVDLLQRYEQHKGAIHGFEAYASYHRGSLYRVRKRFGGQDYKIASELLERALSEHYSNHDLTHYEPFIELILTRYYDPMYDYQMRAKQERLVFAGNETAVKEWVASQCGQS